MRFSARNQLKGKVVEVKKGAAIAHARIDIGGGNIITASITNESADELGLAAGKDDYAIVKASNVMVGSGLTGNAIHRHPEVAVRSAALEGRRPERCPSSFEALSARG